MDYTSHIRAIMSMIEDATYEALEEENWTPYNEYDAEEDTSRLMADENRLKNTIADLLQDVYNGEYSK